MTGVRNFAIERVVFLFALMLVGLAVYVGAPMVRECGIAGGVFACLSVAVILVYLFTSIIWAPILIVLLGLGGFLPIRLTRRTVQVAVAGEVLLMLAYVIFVALQPTPDRCRIA